MKRRPAGAARHLQQIFMVTLWVIGGAVLVLIVLLDSGFSQVGQSYTYTTPTPPAVLFHFIRSARIAQTFLEPEGAIAGFSVVIAGVMIAIGHRFPFGIRLSLAILLTIPLIVVAPLLPMGFIVMFGDFPRVFSGGLDAEWLFEGFDFYEAAALWSLTPLILVFVVLSRKYPEAVPAPRPNPSEEEDRARRR